MSDSPQPGLPPAASLSHAPGSLHRMVRNSGINAVGTVLNLGLNFIAVFVLARRLGKEALGLYFTVFTIGLVVFFILESGITTVLTRRIARAPHDLKRHVSEATGLLLIVSVFAVLLMTGIGFSWAVWRHRMADLESDSVLRVLPLVPIFAAAGFACAGRLVLEFFAAVFRGLELFEYENIARVIQATLFATLVILLVHPPRAMAINTAVGILVVSHAAAALYIVISLQWGWRCIGCSLNRAVLRDWLPESLPLGVGDLIQRITWQVDTILLGWLRPLSEVGLYSIAYRPLQPLNLVPRTVLSVTFPQFSRLAEYDLQALGRAFATSIRLLWIVSLPISIGICFIAEPLVVIPAGEEYARAAEPLRLLIWIVNLSFISTQFRFLFTALGRQMTFARMVMPVLVIKTVLELSLIPFWGYYGACAGSVIAEFAFVGIGLTVCRRLGLGDLDWGLMARALPAAAIMAAILWPCLSAHWLVLILATGVASILYLALAILFGAVTRGELARFRAAARSVLKRRREKPVAVESAISTAPSAMETEPTVK